MLPASALLRFAGALLLAATVLPVAPALAARPAPAAARLVRPAAQAESGATLTILAGEVQVAAGGAAFQPAEDGMTLVAGDHLRTGPAGHALITYFDGSTTQVEPDTELAIQRIEPDSEEQTFAVSLALTVGTLWNRVSQLLGFGAQFEVGGQTATAVVRGTLLGVTVDPEQTLIAWTTEGNLEVHARDSVIQVQPGQKGMAPRNTEPRLIPHYEPHANWLEVDATPGVYVRAVDPRGRSVGYVTPGMPVNQVVDGWTSGGLGKPERFRLPNPIADHQAPGMRAGQHETGRYMLVIEGDQPGPYELTVTGRHRDRVVFQRTIRDHIAVGDRQRVHVDLSFVSGDVAGGAVSGPTPLTTTAPGRAIVTANEWRRAVPRAFWSHDDPAAPPEDCTDGVHVAAAKHWLCAPFQQWIAERGLAAWLGPPRSEAFVERGVRVQYFAHGRLQYHPWLPATWQIQLGLLNDELGRQRPADVPPVGAGFRYVLETEQYVGPPFRAAWETWGLDLLGYPIAPAATVAGGERYQDFQRARLVVRPDGQVKSTPLGDEYLQARGWIR